jgi:hypothetical protein
MMTGRTRPASDRTRPSTCHLRSTMAARFQWSPRDSTVTERPDAQGHDRTQLPGVRSHVCDHSTSRPDALLHRVRLTPERILGGFWTTGHVRYRAIGFATASDHHRPFMPTPAPPTSACVILTGHTPLRVRSPSAPASDRAMLEPRLLCAN